ncbi:TnsA endonuclease N-terminal domain-containing protein [Roseovarius sp. M141]|uniref:TnsA endonuclease N-terminal domain-containing protein n=1 Tax=Roseovarius sp. M141 TaxID=2583806 RepID=UPI0020CB9E37|nr:TnsA endonuclease N-terminal domain-containing protein [Roseovarius sp. M141]MCQ0090248.1 hypothetical protein [Roseovarius sp. M141]
MTEAISYQNTLPSRATRNIPMRSRGSGRGHCLADLPVLARTITVEVESGLEFGTGLVILAQPDLVDLHEQAFTIQFIDPSGRKRNHTIDFLATFADGRKVAVVVKNTAEARKQRFQDNFARITAAIPRHLADEVILVTDRSFSSTQLRNASKLHHFRMFPDPEADEVLTAALRGLSKPTTILEIGLITGLAGRAYRAAFRLIFAGIAHTTETGVISPRSNLFAGGVV